jgi:hypothetical protein
MAFERRERFCKCGKAIHWDEDYSKWFHDHNMSVFCTGMVGQEATLASKPKIKVPPAISILGQSVGMEDEVLCVIAGTREEPKLHCTWSGKSKIGSIARYLSAGKIYDLIDMDEDDAYFKTYVVKESQHNPEAGSSQITVQFSIDKKTNKLEYLSLELDS